VRRARKSLPEIRQLKNALAVIYGSRHLTRFAPKAIIPRQLSRFQGGTLSMEKLVVMREFTPQEFARITSIAPSLQRTWRSRGIFGENSSTGWTRWKLDDLIKAKVFVTADGLGFSRKAARHIAVQAIPGVVAFLMQFDGAIIVELNGHRVKVTPNSPVPETRFFLVAYSERGASFYDPEEWDQRISRHKDASTIAAAVEAGEAQGYAILDLKQIAQNIFDLTGGPLFRCEIESELVP
jgi:hypothetical protein